MVVLVGMVDYSGAKRILVAEAAPSLKDITELSCDGGQIDWGPQSSIESRERLAAAVLNILAPAEFNVSGNSISRFAHEVVRTMVPGKMFVMTEAFLYEWFSSGAYIPYSPGSELVV